MCLLCFLCQAGQLCCSVGGQHQPWPLLEEMPGHDSRLNQVKIYKMKIRNLTGASISRLDLPN